MNTPYHTKPLKYIVWTLFLLVSYHRIAASNLRDGEIKHRAHEFMQRSPNKSCHEIAKEVEFFFANTNLITCMVKNYIYDVAYAYCKKNLNSTQCGKKRE